MNTKIKSLKLFLDEYKNKEEWLKVLTQDAYKYYYQELMNEYIKLSKHPFPNEYIDLKKSLNTYEKHIKYAN